MDKYTENHLLAWADRFYIDDETLNCMRNLVEENPDLLDPDRCHSWQEIERMVISNRVG